MSLNLNYNFLDKLKSSRATIINKTKPNSGELLTASNMPEQIIPPLNTITNFTNVASISPEKIGQYQASPTQIPENFSWRDKKFISKPGNQMLCGSCWAISAAGIIGDNFVVSKMVDFEPELSTTWCLACYKQLQCNGGNPATLFEDISNGGIVSKHCIDYSWCANDDNCNGKATGHFDEGMDLSNLIPNCGCYFGDSLHYKYFIDKPSTISIDLNNMSQNEYEIIVKKHILEKGPVLGGFIVFDNFMSGKFTNINGGVYLETGLYDNFGNLSFDKSYRNDPSIHIKGSHAVAIIGWGIEKNIVIDNEGTKKDVPYWYCRNSWTEKWGNDGGYFKMAMYPYNMVSQFDRIITITDSSNNPQSSGGIVMISASKSPEKVSLNQIRDEFMEKSRLQNDEYYKNENETPLPPVDKKDENKIIEDILKKILNSLKVFVKSIYFRILILLLLIAFLFYLIFFKLKSKPIYSPLKINLN